MKFIIIATLTATALILGGCGAPECEGLDCGHEHGSSTHVHPTIGPHHGSLIELGDEEYHAELVLDDSIGSVTLYLLDAAALDAVATDATEAKINVVHDGAAKQFALQASPQLFDAQGQTSRYTSTEKELHEELDHHHGTAQLVIVIAGKQYRGGIEGGHHHGPDEAAEDHSAE